MAWGAWWCSVKQGVKRCGAVARTRVRMRRVNNAGMRRGAVIRAEVTCWSAYNCTVRQRVVK